MSVAESSIFPSYTFLVCVSLFSLSSFFNLHIWLLLMCPTFPQLKHSNSLAGHFPSASVGEVPVSQLTFAFFFFFALTDLTSSNVVCTCGFISLSRRHVKVVYIHIYWASIVTYNHLNQWNNKFLAIFCSPETVQDQIKVIELAV